MKIKKTLVASLQSKSLKSFFTGIVSTFIYYYKIHKYFKKFKGKYIKLAIFVIVTMVIGTQGFLPLAIIVPFLRSLKINSENTWICAITDLDHGSCGSGNYNGGFLIELVQK